MQTINWKPFCDKQLDYMARALNSRLSVAEGAIRSGKTIAHCLISAIYLETCPDKIHLASGSSMPNAKLNIGDCNGFGLEHLFKGRCHWGKYKGNEALYVQTKTGEKVIIFVGGGKADSYKKILGNSYGLWIATEINEHYDSTDSRESFIKVAFGRQVASEKPFTLWDLNPSSPNAQIYTDYIDKYQEQGLLGGYNYGHFTINDNLSITPERKEQILSMYDPNTVWYKRDILGLRCIAEGLIYPQIADRPKDYIIPKAKEKEVLEQIVDFAIGVDFGEAKSSTTFALLGLLKNADGLVVLADKRINEHGDVELLKRQFREFCKNNMAKNFRLDYTYYDNEQRTLGESLKNTCECNGIPSIVKPCVKDKILDRIHLEQYLISAKKLWFFSDCEESIKAFQNAVWNDKKEERLDDVSDHNPVDMLDAIEYAFYKWQKLLLLRLGVEKL